MGFFSPPQAPQAPQAPGAADPRAILGQMPTPEQEQWLLQRLKLGAGMFSAEPRRITSGAGPAAAWGLSDALGQMLGAHMYSKASQGLQDLGSQRLKARQSVFDLMQPDKGLGPEGNMVASDEARSADTSRLRKIAPLAAMTGDPAMEKMADVTMRQQQQDREYAQLANQIEVQHKELALKEREASLGETKEQHAEDERKFTRGHTLRTEQEWVTTPAPELGGFTHTSKHTGESWLILPGQAPIQISKGSAPGQPSGMGGPAAAAESQPGGKFPPYVKLNEGQAQAAVRGQAGATGLTDALAAGFPSTSTLKSIPESLAWKAAEHGVPQLASADDQARVASWDAVFDPVARMRAGLRIPEEQMSRMRMELRPQPGESWDNHVSKTKRIIDTFRAEAETLPPVKSRPILEELDRVESMLPRTKEAYEAFNTNAVAAMHAKRKGGPAPQSVAVPPRPAGPGAPLRSTGKKAPLQDRVKSYYGGQ